MTDVDDSSQYFEIFNFVDQYLQIIYIYIYVNEPDLVLNNPQLLICH